MSLRGRSTPLAAIALLTVVMVPCAWADPEGSHPLVDRPFPQPAGLRLEVPCAMLVWGKGDPNGMKRLGEAKLKELVSQRPDLHLYAFEVAGGQAALLPAQANALMRHGHVPAEYLKRLQADRTPFIVTVDRKGFVHRLSFVDHWPLLSAVDARFGAPPKPPKSWWQRLRSQFGLD